MSAPATRIVPGRQDEVEAVHDELRRRVLHNVLVAGERVNQAVIARDLGVSRGPVREALRLLQREGLVEHVHQQQMRVSSVSVADLEQLYGMRIVLESFAAGMTAPHLSAEEIGLLERDFEEMNRPALVDNIDDWEEVHARFHMLLVAHVGARIRQEVWELYEHCNRYRRLYLQGEPLAKTHIAQEHKGLLEAARAGDSQSTATRLGEHLGRAALTVASMIDPGHDPATVRAAIRSVSAVASVN